MTPNKAILLLLTTFFATTTVCLSAGNDKRSTPPAETQTAQTPAAGSSKIIAYYFHVTVRCNTCKTIEAYSHEAIFNHFRKDLDGGRLEWRVVNVQLPENKHFVKEYELFTKSVVLVHIAGGKQQSYKILNDVWELVGDKAKFQAYVDEEVRSYLARL